MTAQDETLVAALRAGERRALARVITLLESTRPDHQARAESLLEALLPHAGRSIRIGISGAPGAGKSTFIEALGAHLIALGHRPAVLAVDPSSSRSGGSILGDKTRMATLAREAQAFIRPSPSAGALGGVGERTRETILACEAAGYDVIVVETVGVGQSESALAGMVDVFALMQLANTGDELQAMKKGVIELADVIVVNKSDLDPAAARTAARHLETALSLLRPASPHWKPPVLLLSALRGEGITGFWDEIRRYEDTMKRHAEFDARRRRQALDWMWSLINTGLRQRFRRHAAVRKNLERLSDAVVRGSTSPVAAAAQLLSVSRRDESA